MRAGVDRGVYRIPGGTAPLNHKKPSPKADRNAADGGGFTVSGGGLGNGPERPGGGAGKVKKSQNFVRENAGNAGVSPDSVS